jgi:hypothetical protein
MLTIRGLRFMAISVGILAAAGAARAQAKFLPESNNAALRYWAALVQMRYDPLAVDEETRSVVSATLRGEKAWDEAKLGPIVDASADAIQTMQRGTKLPECNWGLDWQLGGFNDVALVMRSRGLETVNTLEGIREAAKGDGEAAVHTWLAGIEFSQDVGRGGPVILALVGSAMVMDTLEAATGQAKQEKLSEAQKEELYAAVKAMPEDGFDWGIAWGVEYAMGEQFLEGLQTASDPKAVYKRMGMRAPKGLPPRQQDIERYGEYMLASQGALREAPEKAKPLVEDLESRLPSLSQVAMLLALSPVGCNRRRSEVATAREALLEALAAK